eukprot:gene31143-37639_t
MISGKYTIEKAVPSDLPFLGIAVFEAERAHTGRGIWDVALSRYSRDEVIEFLKEACANDTDSHFHVSRFLVARDSSGNPVAAACGFFYPECGLFKSFPGISQAISNQYPNTNSEDASKLWDSLSFLDEAFPDVEYNDSWMIEAVYTDPAHRGQKLAQHILQAVIEEGVAKGHKRMLISCAVGNDAALHSYKKVGFELLGTGHSEECLAGLGSSGYHVLQKSVK